MAEVGVGAYLDDTGLVKKITRNSRLPVSARDYLTEVSAGIIPGAQTIYQNGYNSDIDAGPADVWSGGGLYPWMTAETALEIVSTSANDTAAGTGARTVMLTGLNASHVEVVQILTLNGLTPVAIPTNLYRINANIVATAGSIGTNDGTVTVRDAGGGTTRAVMDAGYGLLRQSQFTVPAGETLFILTATHSINKPTTTRDATVAFYFRAQGGAALLFLEISVNGQPLIIPVVPPAKIPEKTDIGYRVPYVSATNTSFTSAFFGIRETNARLR